MASGLSPTASLSNEARSLLSDEQSQQTTVLQLLWVTEDFS
jgi:hypothetical protein